MAKKSIARTEQYREDIFMNLNSSNILRDIIELSGFGSRVTGYYGANRTATFIATRLSSLNLEVILHPYKTVVPLDLGSSIVISELNDEKICKAFAVWPNGVQSSSTPPYGISGHLLYVHKGKLEDFDDKEVKDSIVLMDYESGDNWLNAAKLGAKAVIFISPAKPSTYSEALKKFVDTPLYFPRLYVDEKTGLDLIEAAERGAKVTVHSKIKYQEITAYNIIGILEGAKKDEVTIISTHYDSWSSVPSLASSSYEVIPVAYLLELARVLSISGTKPYRTVWFVFFSGHWQALSGSREFVEDLYFSSEVQNGTVKPLLMINIGELDPFGQGLELVRGGAGTYFATTDQSSGIESRYVEIKRKIFYSYLLHQNLVSYIKGLTSFSPSDLVKDFLTYQMFWGTESYYYMLDSEPVELSGGIAFTIRSSYAKKDWRGDPYKYNISYNEISLLIPQFAIVTHIISSIINEAELGISWFDVLPRRLFVQKAWGGGIGSCFITLKGRTLEYNLSTGWYTAVPNALTRVRASVDPYPFNDYLVFSDHNGSFEIHGLSAYMFIPGGKYFIDAWVIDELSGKIKYAPNSGIYGAKNIVPAVSPLSHPEECTIILMNVETVELFDVINPQTGTTGLIPDLRSPSQMWFYNVGCMIMVQNFDYKGEPLFYGVYYNGYEPVALAFALPRSRVMIMASVGGLIMPIKSCPFLILINSSEIEPEGHGFLLKEEEKYWYYGDALKYAQDILYVTRFRYNLLKSRGVQSISVEEKLSKAEEYFKEAIHNYSNSVFSQAYTNAFVAWAWGVRAYEEVMSLINDSGRTSLFFFVLILISAFLFERLLFRSISGRKQIGGVLIIGIVLLSFFSFIHPALQIMTNSLMAVLGLLSLVLFALVFIILVDETRKTLKEISYRILGYHAVEVGRISLTSITFTTSIENMRRRKMRTLLVFITLLTIAFSLTSLTSISPYIGVKFVPYGVPFPDSSDILIKNGISTPTRDILGSHTIDIIKGIIGERAEIMPRVWYYPTSIGPNIGVVTRISCLDKNLTYPINAVLGLTYQEAILLLSKYATTPILPSSVGEFWCLIPDSAANILDVNIGEYILFQGMRIRIIGIYNSSLAGSSLIDLRGNSIAPIDPYYVASLGIGVTVPLASGQEPPSLSWSRFIVIPYDVALKMGGYVAEISLRFMYNVDKEVMEKILRELSNVLDITVYAKIDNNVFVSSRVSTFSAFGLEGVIVLLVISSFNVIVTLLNIQRERIRDMYVYATIGLSPSGAILMTILEALVYSALSITVGYFLGFVGNTVFRSLGILPATFAFNYASVFAMMSLLILFVAALISSFYPAHVASRLITPSLERKWKPPTEPRGDAWELPLPLKLEQIEEVRGLMLFLKEYYLGVGIEKPSFRIDNLKVDFSNPKGPEIILTVSLVPYEANTKESVRVIAQYIDAENKYAFITLMRKESGDKNLWIHGSYEFADDLRRQILLWRLLPEERRRKYISMAKGEG